MEFKEGFVIWRGLVRNSELGVLEHPARTAIHFTHRIGAIVVTTLLLVLAVMTLRAQVSRAAKRAALGMLVLLVLQVTLGVSNVVYGLPLHVAVAHNGVAAMLLLSMIMLTLTLSRQSDSDNW